MNPAVEPPAIASAETQAAPENTNARERAKSIKPASSRLFATINRSKLLVAFLGMLGAAVAPVTTLIYKNAEIDLKTQELKHAQLMEVQKQEHSQAMEKSKQQHEFEDSFLRKTITEDKQTGDNLYRRDVLEFYATVLEQGNPVRKFAETMLGRVEASIKLVEEIKASDAQLKTTERKLQEKEQEIKGLNAKIQRHAKEGLKEQLKALQEELVAREDLAVELRQQVSDERTKVVALSNGLRERDPCPTGSELITSVGPDALPFCITGAPKQMSSSVFWTIDVGAKKVTCACKPVSK